jgi:hypothetical protein
MAAQDPQALAPHRLNLVIVEGDGAINNIKQRTSRETIVQVEDENHKPVAGAVVAFLLPDNGPGGTFVTGSKSATVVTDSSGRAVMPRMQLNPNSGRFEIRVHASSQGLEATATIAQSTAVAAGGVATGTIIGIVAGVAAAGAVAAVVASRGGNKSSTPTPAPPSVPSGTIGTGTGIIIGPPR